VKVIQVYPTIRETNDQGGGSEINDRKGDLFQKTGNKEFSRSLKPNFKTRELAGCRANGLGLTEYILAHLFPQIVQKAVNLARKALDHKLHFAVRQIADEASDLKRGGQRAGGISEADPLHPAGKQNFAFLKIGRGHSVVLQELNISFPETTGNIPTRGVAHPFSEDRRLLQKTEQHYPRNRLN
jgi:hypothetical protein